MAKQSPNLSHCLLYAPVPQVRRASIRAAAGLSIYRAIEIEIEIVRAWRLPETLSPALSPDRGGAIGRRAILAASKQTGATKGSKYMGFTTKRLMTERPWVFTAAATIG